MFNDVYDLIETALREHKETYQSDQMRDYMDVFIKQMDKDKEVLRLKVPVNEQCI
jgi:hypothetical protein